MLKKLESAVNTLAKYIAKFGDVIMQYLFDRPLAYIKKLCSREPRWARQIVSRANAQSQPNAIARDILFGMVIHYCDSRPDFDLLSHLKTMIVSDTIKFAPRSSKLLDKAKLNEAYAWAKYGLYNSQMEIDLNNLTERGRASLLKYIDTTNAKHCAYIVKNLEAFTL